MNISLVVCLYNDLSLTHLFQQVDELIPGQPLQQREVRDFRGISPGTVSHAGAQSLYPLNIQKQH